MSGPPPSCCAANLTAASMLERLRTSQVTCMARGRGGGSGWMELGVQTQQASAGGRDGAEEGQRWWKSTSAALRPMPLILAATSAILSLLPMSGGYSHCVSK